jgi:hypothetical protein
LFSSSALSQCVNKFLWPSPLLTSLADILAWVTGLDILELLELGLWPWTPVSSSPWGARKHQHSLFLYKGGVHYPTSPTYLIILRRPLLTTCCRFCPWPNSSQAPLSNFSTRPQPWPTKSWTNTNSF